MPQKPSREEMKALSSLVDSLPISDKLSTQGREELKGFCFGVQRLSTVIMEEIKIIRESTIARSKEVFEADGEEGEIDKVSWTAACLATKLAFRQISRFDTRQLAHLVATENMRIMTMPDSVPAPVESQIVVGLVQAINKTIEDGDEAFKNLVDTMAGQ